MTIKQVLSFDTLRKANIERDKEWGEGHEFTAAFRGTELAGEAGEVLEVAFELMKLSIAAGKAANILKKMERESLGLKGSRATIADLANELADVVICADLSAMKFNINMSYAIAAKFNATTRKMKLTTFIDIDANDYMVKE